MARQNQMRRDDQSGISASPGFTTETFGTPEGYRTIVTALTAFPAIAGGANLAVGKKAVTLPAGARRVKGSNMSLAMKQTQGNVTADTPDLGIGTTIGSGVVAVLGGTAAFEDILTGQTAADCNGTATVAAVTTELLIAAAASHDIYVNVADGWAASGDTGLLLSGTFEFNWR